MKKAMIKNCIKKQNLISNVIKIKISNFIKNLNKNVIDGWYNSFAIH